MRILSALLAKLARQISTMAVLAALLVSSLPARAELVVEWWGRPGRCPREGMTIELSKYGKKGLANPKGGQKDIEGIHALTFDLSPLKKDTTIYHASLRIRAPLERIRTDKRAYMSLGQGHWYHDPLRLYAEMPAWKPVEIFVAQPGSAPGKPVYDKAKPLVLEPPRLRSFDCTQAVRDWVSGAAPNLGFIVRQLDLWDWDPGKTVLEIRYEGKVQQAPTSQPAGLKAVHRQGQTFLTWTEIDKIIDKEEIAWKEFEETFRKVSPRGNTFYRVYRGDKPITAANLHQAALVDEIWPLSGYDGRVHEHMTRGEDWEGLNPNLIVPRYVIEDPSAGPLTPTDQHRGAPVWHGKQLPLHTGLYVHQPAAAGKAYYAVTVLVDGVENTTQLTAGNSLAQPVEETTGAGEPILYRVLDQSKEHPPGPRETQFFVYWAAPPYANQPRRPIHLLVGINGLKSNKKTNVRYNVGDMYGSELNQGTHAYEWKLDVEFHYAIVCDGSFGGNGYWPSWNTLLSKDQTKQEPYAQRIIERFQPLVEKLTPRLCGGTGKATGEAGTRPGTVP